jgi:hypothetical protein
MTSEEVIGEFSLLVHVALCAQGQVAFNDPDGSQETSVHTDDVRLAIRTSPPNNSATTVYSFAHKKWVFIEIDNGDNTYNIHAMRELLPHLRVLTVLDLMTDI